MASYTQKGGWIATVKENSFESVAANLGINERGGRYGACPVCEAERTGTKDKRFPIGVTRGTNTTGWRCFACGAAGDMLDLVSFSLNGCKFRDAQDKKSIREFFNVKQFTSTEVTSREKERLPEDDLRRLFESMKGRKVSEANHTHVNAYLSGRGIDFQNTHGAFVFNHHFAYNDLKKVATSQGRMMPFWPYKWARDYPICVPMWDKEGKIASFQGRAIAKMDNGRKTMCPISFSMSGLIFACKNSLQWLRGEKTFKEYWIVEGEIDFLTLTSMEQFNDICVIGIKNGSLPFFWNRRFPAAARVVVATDNDPKGGEYASKIAQAVYPLVPARLMLRDYTDINMAVVDGVEDITEYVQGFPNYDDIIAMLGKSMIIRTYEKIEDAPRKTRVEAVTELTEHVESMAQAFIKYREECEKFWFRLQSLHGCGQIARQIKTRVDRRIKGHHEQKREVALSGNIVTEELEGPDPRVTLVRKIKKENGVVVGYGEIKALEQNLVSILSNDRRLKGRFRYNEHADTVEIDGKPISDNLVLEISIWIQQHYESFRMDLNSVGRTIDYVASMKGNSYHPVAEMLQGFYTDVDLSEAPDYARPEELFTHYFGADLGPNSMYKDLIREYSKRFCITLVKRALDPGCKADSLPVLIGPQGCGKSTGLKAIACRDEFFSDTPFDVKSKDAYQMLRGVWLYEIGEAESLLKGGFRAVKGFITAQVDRYRKPYRTHVTSSPRGGTFATTSNETQIEFLSDPSGSRRYHAMLVGTHHKVRVEDIRRDAPFIWARTMHMFHGTGEYLEDGPDKQNWLPDDYQSLSRRLNEKFGSGDPWVQFVGGWCQQRWNEWAFQKKTKGTAKVSMLDVNIKEILSDVLSVPAHKQTRAEMKRVGEVLSQIGVDPHGQKRVGKRRVNIWRIPEDYDELEQFDVQSMKK